MFNESSAIWGKKTSIPVRELGGNRFLVEFDSEELWKRVTEGGPWKHKDDAVIFVPYDGTQHLSKVVIESMALWIWIYDIPLKMMTEGFARVLGVKIGRVLQVGNAVQDYKRVKVDFPLAKPLMHYVELIALKLAHQYFAIVDVFGAAEGYHVYAGFCGWLGWYDFFCTHDNVILHRVIARNEAISKLCRSD